MNTTHHTAGPWEVTEFCTPVVGQAGGHRLEIHGEIGYVAEIDLTLGGGSGRAKHQANARLIAAAPDLLEALQNFLVVTDPTYIPKDVTAGGVLSWPDGLTTDLPGEIYIARKAARAAIAKAEGRV